MLWGELITRNIQSQKFHMDRCKIREYIMTFKFYYYTKNIFKMKTISLIASNFSFLIWQNLGGLVMTHG